MDCWLSRVYYRTQNTEIKHRKSRLYHEYRPHWVQASIIVVYQWMKFMIHTWLVSYDTMLFSSSFPPTRSKLYTTSNLQDKYLLIAADCTWLSGLYLMKYGSYVRRFAWLSLGMSLVCRTTLMLSQEAEHKGSNWSMFVLQKNSPY